MSGDSEKELKKKPEIMNVLVIMDHLINMVLGWFVGCTGCTLQTFYAWLVRDLYVCVVGILIYRILHLPLGCDSWCITMLLIQLNNTKCLYLLFTIYYTYKLILQLSQCSSDNLVACSEDSKVFRKRMTNTVIIPTLYS